jgi:hypothetical protein
MSSSRIVAGRNPTVPEVVADVVVEIAFSKAARRIGP